MCSSKQKLLFLIFLFFFCRPNYGYDKTHCQELYHRKEKPEDAKGAVNDEKEKKGGNRCGRRVKLTAPRYVACNSKNQVINTIHQLQNFFKAFFVYYKASLMVLSLSLCFLATFV